MSNPRKLFRNPVLREAAILLLLLLLGLLVLPLAVFYVGELVFGDYGGDGFGQFYESLLVRLASPDRFAWFLVLSPYIVVQLIRMAMLAWRLSAKRPA